MGGLPCLSSPCPSLLGDAPVGPGSPERVHPTKVLCPPVPWHRVPPRAPHQCGCPPTPGYGGTGQTWTGHGMEWGGNGGQWASPQGGEGNGHPTATHRDPPRLHQGEGGAHVWECAGVHASVHIRVCVCASVYLHSRAPLGACVGVPAHARVLVPRCGRMHARLHAHTCVCAPKARPCQISLPVTPRPRVCRSTPCGRE